MLPVAKSLMSEDHLVVLELRDQIDQIPCDPEAYSDPSRILELPFPSLCKMPTRFKANPCFSYMGREKFQEIWSDFCKVRYEYRRQRSVYVCGSRGYGTSHILAAMACLLIQQGELVVYFPDCAAMLADPLAYLKSAFKLAFCRPPHAYDLEEVLECNTIDELCKLCESIPDLCFIIDQADVFNGNDKVALAEKGTLHQLFGRLGFGRITITGVSANRQSLRDMRHDQIGNKKVALYGGMSDCEVRNWWRHHADHFSSYSLSDIHRVQDLTGNLPLLLTPFLSPETAGMTLDSLEPDIWRSGVLASVVSQVTEYAEARTEHQRDFEITYVPLMRNCLTKQVVGYYPDLDDRHFYLETSKGVNREGRYTSGLARQAMIAFLRESGEDSIFLSVAWLSAIRSFKNNSSVVGFMFESVVISTISTRGLTLENIRIEPTKVTPFRGSVATIDRHRSAFYVPLDFTLKQIDALYIHIDFSTRSAHLMAIQVNVSKKHKDSEAAFFSMQREWASYLSEYQLKWSFVWIVTDPRHSQEFQEKFSQLRTTGKFAFPSYTTYWVPLHQLDWDLAQLYRQVRDEVSWQL